MPMIEIGACRWESYKVAYVLNKYEFPECVMNKKYGTEVDL